MKKEKTKHGTNVSISPGDEEHKQFIKRMTDLRDYFFVNQIETMMAANLMLNMIVSFFVTNSDKEALQEFFDTGLKAYDINMEKK